MPFGDNVNPIQLPNKQIGRSEIKSNCRGYEGDDKYKKYALHFIIISEAKKKATQKLERGYTGN